ncbi:membrane metallo-endopeptidase-like 1 [Cloeon dipterum]|uniref:membrane metallo-endopeptidase-like 1 n=1 Tax=Cloeon dipterum TaxID=197152 RepID=UPI00321FDEDB
MLNAVNSAFAKIVNGSKWMDETSKNASIDKVKDITAIVDGVSTMNENIADNSGLTAAFRAYKRIRPVPKKQTLKGLESYTPDQLFFLAYANALCSSETAEFTESTILSKKTGLSPFRFRVNVPLKNFQLFAKAWNCPRGSKMSPYKNDTCKVW